MRVCTCLVWLCIETLQYKPERSTAGSFLLGGFAYGTSRSTVSYFIQGHGRELAGCGIKRTTGRSLVH